MKRCFHCMEEYEDDLDCCPSCLFTGEQEKGSWLETGTILQGRYIVGTCRYQKKCDFLYIGWDALFSRIVLIQEFFPKRCAVRENEAGLEIIDSESFFRGKELFKEIGLKQISLDDTPGLINVYSVFEENETVYITMEYPGEQSLLNMIETCGCFNETDMLNLLEALSVPLLSAHERQIFHGQLCLDVCFFDNKGGYKLGGFQPARYLYEEREFINEKTDVRGLANLAGIVLFGEKVWENSSEEEQQELLERNCSVGIGDVLKCALKEDSCDCPETIDIFMNRLLESSKKRNQERKGTWPFWKKGNIQMKLL